MICKLTKQSEIFIRSLFISLFSFTCSGCVAGLLEAKPVAMTKPAKPVSEVVYKKMIDKPDIRYEGSLWEKDGPLNELFINPTARRVGDIVTIEIVESAEASNEADTSTERTSSLSWTLEKLFGMEDKYPITTGSHSWYNPFSSLKGSMAGAFDGKGATTRKGALTADITAMVTDVLPNGNLKIKGSREVTVNNESQYITLTGIIRPKDISTDNIVKSTRISEARIAYSGAGMITDRQKPGWLATILNKFSPF